MLKQQNIFNEFQRKYNFLSKEERQLLNPNKVDFFLQSTDRELEEKLKFLHENKKKDKELILNWKDIEEIVGLLTKKEKRK